MQESLEHFGMHFGQSFDAGHTSRCTSEKRLSSLKSILRCSKRALSSSFLADGHLVLVVVGEVVAVVAPERAVELILLLRRVVLVAVRMAPVRAERTEAGSLEQ